jgi:hypothetical protein
VKVPPSPSALAVRKACVLLLEAGAQYKSTQRSFIQVLEWQINNNMRNLKVGALLLALNTEVN